MDVDAALAEANKVDYDRIGERMHAEMVYVECNGDAAAFVEAVKKVTGKGKTIVLACKDADAAKAALDVCKAEKPILNGADASNYEKMVELAKEAGVVLGVSGADINELYDTAAAIEKLGYKDLVLDTTGATIKETLLQLYR